MAHSAEDHCGVGRPWPPWVAEALRQDAALWPAVWPLRLHSSHGSALGFLASGGGQRRLELKNIQYSMQLFYYQIIQFLKRFFCLKQYVPGQWLGGSVAAQSLGALETPALLARGSGARDLGGGWPSP